jgi:hypothetical protein
MWPALVFNVTSDASHSVWKLYFIVSVSLSVPERSGCNAREMVSQWISQLLGLMALTGAPAVRDWQRAKSKLEN